MVQVLSFVRLAFCVAALLADSSSVLQQQEVLCEALQIYGLL